MIRAREKSWRMLAIPLGILFSLFLPLPPTFLDLCLCLNFALSLAVVFWVFSVKSPASARVFPQLFLYLCLFRLGLNLASTRWIFSSGWASPMIFSLGNFFSLGSVGAGIVASCLFFLVNFFVVSKGAERVAEVRARFILEALPGKQMSMDADLLAGRSSLIDIEKNRQHLSEECDFFSAMEGALRFVKGDVIVGCILFITNCLAAAFFIVSEGVEGETIWMTVVGDVLVSQIPALLTSCAAATLISKVGSEHSLLESTWGYYTHIRPYFRGIACILSFLLLIPGIAKFPIFLVIGVLLYAYKERQQEERKEERVCVYVPKSCEAPEESYSQACRVLFQELGISLEERSSLIYVEGEERICIRYGENHIRLQGSSSQDFLCALRSLAFEFVHRKHIRALLEEAQEVWGVCIDEIIPKKISENTLLFLMKGLVKERITLRLFPKILEGIALHGSLEDSLEVRLEKIRKYLGKHIGQALWNREHSLEVITVDTNVERMISDSYSKSNPMVHDNVIHQVQDLLKRSIGGDFRAIVTDHESRCEIRKIIEPYFPNLLVLSHNELPEEIPISVLGTISDEVLILKN